MREQAALAGDQQRAVAEPDDRIEVQREISQHRRRLAPVRATIVGRQHHAVGANRNAVLRVGEQHVMQGACASASNRSEEHTSELQSLMRHSYAVFCLKKKKLNITKDKQSTSLSTS